MTNTCGPKVMTPGGCQPKTEVFWAQKPADASPVLLYLQTTCLGGLASRTLTHDKDGLVSATGYTEADKLANALKRERGASCQDPVHVSICEPLGAVKLELSETLLYSASTEQTVMRVRIFNEDLGTWSLVYENLDGTPFIGTLPPDLTAVSAQVQVVRTEVSGCSAGQVFTQRTEARFDAETGVLESEVTTWRDSTGAVSVVAPAGWSFGPCSCVQMPSTMRSIQQTWPTGLLID